MKTMQLLWYSFRHGFIRGLKYGYFAPLMVLVAACTRPGGYLRHLRALYRLTFGGKW